MMQCIYSWLDVKELHLLIEAQVGNIRVKKD